MPLIDLSAEEALANRKGNPYATWGERTAPDNRVEPFAKPAFEAPFRLERGEAIFTVGSCFARNVEAELMRLGFRIPVREMLQREEFRSLDASIINNFGTPSIYNEFAWAFGEQPFSSDDHIVAVGSKFADLHVSATLRPERLDIVQARRKAISEAYRSAADCRVIVMTLGLSEVWFDTKTGYYLNVAPRPSLVKEQPDRFRLRVLSFEEAYGFLDKTLHLLKKHGRPDLRVILTVSPVPLNVTHRPDDVIVANTYSKSVLRVAAEHALIDHPFVIYFPSYESVLLSDRRRAWEDDMIHVTADIVRLNVNRMVAAYIGEQEVQGTAAIVIRARELVECGHLGDAARLVEGSDEVPLRALEVEILVRQGRAQEALARAAAAGGAAGPLWDGVMRAAVDLRDMALVAAVMEQSREAAAFS
jgi:hypothetical protein